MTKDQSTRKGASRGAAWLSSARAVRCMVKSHNEHNPCPMLQSHFGGSTLGRLPWLTGRKVGMTANHHGLYVRGYTRATMVTTKGNQLARGSKSLKSSPSSDRGLQLAHVKLESLVIANQQVAVNTFPGLVHTARHTMEADCNRISVVYREKL